MYHSYYFLLFNAECPIDIIGTTVSLPKPNLLINIVFSLKSLRLLFLNLYLLIAWPKHCILSVNLIFAVSLILIKLVNFLTILVNYFNVL